MENPAEEIKTVIESLTQGTPEEQHDAIYRYFAPGATFSHPFCRVPSFKKLHLPGVGELDSRALITAIYRWYKIMSPKIELEIESCAFDERANLIYLKIFQVFSIWLIPFYRAPVNLVTVLHLTSKPAVDGVPPPPYDGAQGKVDAAQETLHKVQEGAEPSYASVAAGDASGGLSRTSSSSSAAGGPRRYYIQRQEDLYQVNEFLKFLTLSLGPSVWGFVQLFATLFCVVGMALLGPLMKVVSPAKPEKARKA